MSRLITLVAVVASVLLVGGVSLVGPVGCNGTFDPNATLAQLVTQLAQDPNALALLNQVTVGQVLATLQQGVANGASQSGSGGPGTGGWVSGGGGDQEDPNDESNEPNEPNEPAHHGHVGRGAVLLREVFNAAPFTATFTPLATGDTITVTVAGGDLGSRLTFAVIDDANNPVASVTDPNTNVSQTTFTSAGTGTFTLTATETGTVASAYVAWVVETLAAPPTREVPVLLLTKTFTAAPITATFTPTDPNRLIEVDVAGNNGSSRLTIEVTDPNGAVVATADSAGTNVAKTTFNSTSTGTYTLTATETGTASTVYVVHVLEAGNVPGGVPGFGGPVFRGGSEFVPPGHQPGGSRGRHPGGGNNGRH